MSDAGEWRSIARQGFLSSARVSAAATHEIRNKLAVVNEKAGLIADLAMFQARGRPLDPDQLNQQALAIKDQVRQADQVVAHLNRFAHSADHPVLRTDAAELVALVVDLSARKIATAGVQLDLSSPPDPTMLSTSPFLFQDLVFRCLDLALACGTGSRRVGLSVEPTEGAVRVRFSGLTRVDEHLADLRQTAEAGAAMEAVQARLRAAGDGTELVLEVEDLGDPAAAPDQRT